IDNKVIRFGKNVHIPKSYHRFQGVIEKLFQEKKIISKNELLLDMKEQTFSELIKEINPSSVIGFSTEGELSSYQKIASEIPDNSCIVLGGFQKGHFSDSVQNEITNLYSVGNESFEGHVVTSRILYEYEKTIFM
ncbi:MAG: ribosome biogenesis protein, partial [Nitrosopumilus sp.]|nr:ribosome biogenesis protein [Nitrosopumilus sp.]